MAFLHSAAQRPSCIVSALPKRFRDSLERDLGGSVALTTCAVEEIEKAVKVRGATMAIIGASPDSIGIAERLSHDEQAVKVFLAHYRDGGAPSTPVNGFAGVFDLRVETKGLAATIRETAATPASRFPASVPPTSRRRVLSHFLDMQRRLHNPTALFETMLDAFLDIARANEGVLALSGEGDRHRLRVAAGQHGDLFLTSHLLTLDCSQLEALDRGENLRAPDAFAVSNAEDVESGRFSVALPILAGGGLRACFLTDQMTESTTLDDLTEGAAFLFELLAKSERTARRERILAEARRAVSTSWILTDPQGRVIHREGPSASRLAGSGEVQQPRLRDAMARCSLGENVTAQVADLTVSCSLLPVDSASYCLLALNPPLPRRTFPAPIAPKTQRTLPAQRFEAEEYAFVQTLLEQISSGVEAAFDLKKELATFEISIAPVSVEVPPAMARPIALILLAAKEASRQPVTGKLSRLGDSWYLAVEAREEALSNSSAAWTCDPLIEWSLGFSGMQEIQRPSCLFGFQIEFRAAACV